MAVSKHIVCFVILITGSIICLSMCLVLKVWGPHVPRIDISPETVDLGVIDSLEPNIPERIAFKIRNRGTDVLKLNKIQFTCACAEPLLDKQVLLPGETAQLSIRFRVTNRIGDFRKNINIHSNDPLEPVKEIVIKGFTHRPCYVLPDSININNLRENEEKKFEMEVTGPVGDRYFTILDVSTINNEIKLCQVEKIGTIVESSRPVWRIILTVVSRGMIKWEDTIRISTSSNESPFLEVPVKINEQPYIIVKPATVIFRYNDDSKKSLMQVDIINNTSKPFKIIDIEKPEWIDIEIESDKNNLPVKLLLTMNKVSGNIYKRENILLKTGDGFNEVNIPVIRFPAPVKTTSLKSNVSIDG